MHPHPPIPGKEQIALLEPFERLGLDTSQTEEDLYYALQAFNRLDERAEFHYDLPGVRDGFFQRGDVPWDFITLSDGSPRFPNPDPDVPGFGCVKSEEACVARMGIDEGFFMSQDQVIGMLWGLGLVWRLVPDGVEYQGVGLREEAQQITHNMITHLRDHLWRVTDPEGNHPPDAWGGNAIAFSDQLARAANRICGDRFGLDDYRDGLSNTLGVNAFIAFDASWLAQIGYNKTMALTLVGLSQEWDVDKVTNRSVELNKDAFALSYALLNQVEPGEALSIWSLESILNSAPCGGPCHRTPGCEEVYGWMGEDRFRNPEQLFGNKHHNVNDFNGLDYMLLHNLVFLAEDGEHLVQVPEALVGDCADFVDLDAVLQGQGTVYDPFSACAAPSCIRTCSSIPGVARMRSGVGPSPSSQAATERTCSYPVASRNVGARP